MTSSSIAGVPAATPVEQKPGAAAEAPERPAWRTRLAQRPATVYAGAILLLIIAAAAFAPMLTAEDPLDQVLDRRLQSPRLVDAAGTHLLGTDHLGRDVASRLLFGARVSLIIGLVTVVLSGTAGTGLGLWAGFRGGLVDETVMRLVDVQNTFPFIVLAIAIVAVFGPKLPVLILTLAIWGWASYARVVRAEVLSLKEREYVVAARAAGAGEWRILTRHLLPGLLPTLIVLSTFQVAQMIIAESSLSFLGLGVQPPTPTWGSMLADGRGHLDDAWWIATFPALAIMATVLAINILGDALRDVTDPRMGQ
jgi:ABC-type dipeptide/oligopeptide/nickel transport system permease subunit